ncbi:MAG: triose-phosphate isomerase [Nitrospinaceae bacterium]|nr:triose-phosphate isomerase [Nitrospinaceae bacterium]
MRRPIIAGNWKMNMLISNAAEWVDELLVHLPVSDEVDVIVAPPFTALAAVQDRIEKRKILLAGQNIGPEPEGARTGEVSAAMLKDAGCDYVILGHSERRQFFAESDELINRKLNIACDHGLISIICVGESLEERNAGQTHDVVERQLVGGLAGVVGGQLDRLVIAYEPVWAIGTGLNASPEQAQDVHRFIRNWINKIFGSEQSAVIRVIYGGSVKPETSAPLMAQQDIDGLLVGGASLKSDSFYDIINSSL